MDKATAAVVKFTVAGDFVECLPSTEGGNITRCSIGGYGSPEKPHAANPATVLIPDGVPAVDIREAVQTKEGFDWVFKGPMVDAALAPGQCREFVDGRVKVGGMSVERGPLDYVSVEEWVAGWRAHGARVGFYKNGSIVWEE